MRNTMSIWGYFSAYSSHRLEHFCAHTWMHPEYHTQTSHHITSCRWKHWATGSLSESGGRRRPAMTAGGFSQHLTGGGEPSHLIDYRQDLCGQDCRCGLQDAALIWWRTLSASLLLTFFFSFICPLFLSLHFLSLSFIQCPSSSPPFTLLITPSSSLPRRCFFPPHQHISLQGIWAKPLRQMDDDEWWGKPDPSLPLCLFLPLFLPFFYMVLTLFSLMHFRS